jgi:hypothetical protein
MTSFCWVIWEGNGELVPMLMMSMGTGSNTGGNDVAGAGGAGGAGGTSGTSGEFTSSCFLVNTICFSAARR